MSGLSSNDRSHVIVGDSDVQPKTINKRAIVAAAAGNAVELFDWTIYATFAIYFSSRMFPMASPGLALTATLSTYAIAFFVRPVGGYLMGRFADRHGRRSAMMLSVSLMAGGSTFIAIMPTFDVIGWFAPILLLSARVGQAISMSGELPNASAYLSELAPAEKRGKYVSIIYISVAFALLSASSLALLLTSILTTEQLSSWGWRVPFALGGLLGLVVLWLRREMDETDQFIRNKVRAMQITQPLRTTLRDYPGSVVQVIGLVSLGTLAYYTLFSAIIPFAVTFRNVDAGDMFLAITIGTGVFLLLQYPIGMLSDKIGRKPLLLVFSGGYTIVAVPLSMLIRPSLSSLLIAVLIGLTLLSLHTAVVSAVLSELFPTALRATGIGAWYNLGTAVFGGTAPLIINALGNSGRSDYFFWYLSAVAAFSFIVTIFLPETKGKILD
ncbi:MFS transporter [Rhodococcus sp. RS1C4]|nr:MFS transporter [Rhodococcus sp. RS1C4]